MSGVTGFFQFLIVKLLPQNNSSDVHMLLLLNISFLTRYLLQEFFFGDSSIGLAWGGDNDC